MRQLATDLEQETGLTLGDFDVLAQLAGAGGELRMTELAARAFISRSGMTRRVDRLVEEGLVRRANADADARGVVVALTDAGVARLPRPRRSTCAGSPSCSWRDSMTRSSGPRARPGQGHPRLHVWLKASPGPFGAHGITGPP